MAKKGRGRTVRSTYRSGLELDIAKDLRNRGEKFKYETLKVKWVLHEDKTYTPDFILPNGVIIEAKGRFTLQDRKKHLAVRKQKPDLDIRFVFSNSRGKLYKGSKSTYASWCEKFGFQYADKRIPDDWLK